MANLLEYALGSSPMGEVDESGITLPGLTTKIEQGPEGSTFVMSFPQRKQFQLTQPLRYIAEFSATLEPESWEDNGEVDFFELSGDLAIFAEDWEMVEVRKPVTGREFSRLRVTFQPELEEEEEGF